MISINLNAANLNAARSPSGDLPSWVNVGCLWSVAKFNRSLKQQPPETLWNFDRAIELHRTHQLLRGLLGDR